jgi:zinc protease
MGEIAHGLNGGASPADLEALFQLIYLRFTQPRADPAAFAAVRAQTLALLQNQDASPEAAFSRTLTSALTGDHPRRQPETPTTVAQWDLQKSLAFYKARFANAANFTFIFVGSFAPDAIRPLVETYLASLPSAQTRETWRDVGITPPKGIIEKTVRKGIAPRAEVSIVFSGAFRYDDGDNLAMRAVVLLLQSRLSEAIREELGATYSITADAQTTKFPRPEYRLRIEWTCDPARTDAVVKRVFEEIAFVKATRLTPDRVARVQEILARELEQNRQENGYLLSQLARRYEDGEPDAAGVSTLSGLGALNGYAIQLAARSYLDSGNYVNVTLLPEAQ